MSAKCISSECRFTIYKISLVPHTINKHLPLWNLFRVQSAQPAFQVWSAVRLRLERATDCRSAERWHGRPGLPRSEHQRPLPARCAPLVLLLLLAVLGTVPKVLQKASFRQRHKLYCAIGFSADE